MDAIMNMLLAGWCADAIGARLEFRKIRFSEKVVRDAMRFQGQSTTFVGKGQITDDSELELSLLYALLKENDKTAYPQEMVAKSYLAWLHSEPFDVGNTTSLAFTGARNADEIYQNVQRYNQTSESNGALMRSAGLAAYYWNASPAELMQIAKQDAQMTHASSVVHEANGLYVVAVAGLIQCAVENVRPDADAIIKWMMATVTEPTIKQWIEEGLMLETLEMYNALVMVGHVKHAFIMVVYFLNNIEKYSYETAIMETLQCGGDTDTNAKIVGSLVGAYYQNCIPSRILNTVLEFDSSNSHISYPRPLRYNVLHAVRYLRMNQHNIMSFDLSSECNQK